MIDLNAHACMDPCPPPEWWQQGTCGDAKLSPRPAFDQQFRQLTLPAARCALLLGRQAQLEVIHTVIANLTADGRERSFDDKRCGMGFPPGSRAAEVIPEVPPLADELVLRNIGIHTLVVIGLPTDPCIDHTVKDAVDRGDRVGCPPDACQAETPGRHSDALECFQEYCEQVSVTALEAAMLTPMGCGA
jgi:nicotinamidase-related amidase